MAQATKNWKKTLARVVLYSFSASLVLLSLIFAYTVFRPIDVLSNWTITTSKQSYVPGEPVIINSTFTKLMNVQGVSSRYLICRAGDSEERIKLNVVDANRAVGTKSAFTTVQLPDDINNLPRVCHIEAVVTYNIYGYRQFIEVGDSNDFTVSGV